MRNEHKKGKKKPSLKTDTQAFKLAINLNTYTVDSVFALLAVFHGHRLCRSLFKHMHIKPVLIKAYFKKCLDKYFNSFFLLRLPLYFQKPQHLCPDGVFYTICEGKV